jgi:hypothetical protein
VLDEYSDTLGARLATLMRPLIDQDLSVVFYDLTTVGVTLKFDIKFSISRIPPFPWPIKSTT